MVPIRWLVLPHNQRIWEVRCESFSLPYSQLIKIYQKHLKDSAGLRAGCHCFIIMFVTIIFLAERRKKWASQSSTILKELGDPEDLAGQAKTASRLGWLVIITWVVMCLYLLRYSVKLAILIGSCCGIGMIPFSIFMLYSSKKALRKALQGSHMSKYIADKDSKSANKEKWF